MPDQPYCDICGEQHATIQGSECGYCDECFAQAAADAIEQATGRLVCRTVIRYGGFKDMPNLALCLEPRGTEHDHSS